MIVGASLEKRAFELCVQAHGGQYYGDQEYFHHPLAVANLARELGFGSFVIAECLLHDTVEDTSFTPSILYEEEIPLPVIWGINCMTYTGSDEDEKMALALSNPLSHIGKNCDADRNKAKCIETNDPRLERYIRYCNTLAPGLPTPLEVDQYCFDFMRDPDDIRAELLSMKRVIADMQSPALEYIITRAKSLGSILRDQKAVLELISR